MVEIWLLVGALSVWYGYKAVKANPKKPDWGKALAATAFWPLSIFVKKY
ncbi:hypothetical protein [Fibrisoma montanum]|nr:hypothetical protein [Fibrisoma montanum]